MLLVCGLEVSAKKIRFTAMTWSTNYFFYLLTASKTQIRAQETLQILFLTNTLPGPELSRVFFRNFLPLNDLILQ